MEIEVKKLEQVTEGQHNGTIVEVKDRKGKSKVGVDYHYLDFVIKLDDSDATIKYGCTPTFTTDAKRKGKSKLAKLWENLTLMSKLSNGKETINTEDAVGTKVIFMAQEEDGFVNVVDNSVKVRV